MNRRNCYREARQSNNAGKIHDNPELPQLLSVHLPSPSPIFSVSNHEKGESDHTHDEPRIGAYCREQIEQRH